MSFLVQKFRLLRLVFCFMRSRLRGRLLTSLYLICLAATWMKSMNPSSAPPALRTLLTSIRLVMESMKTASPTSLRAKQSKVSLKIIFYKVNKIKKSRSKLKNLRKTCQRKAIQSPSEN